MKTSLLAQTLVQEFSTRVEFATRFKGTEIVTEILASLGEGSDTEDRAQSVRLALLRSNIRSKPEDVIATARKILNWPPKTEPVRAARPAQKPAARKGLRRK